MVLNWVYSPQATKLQDGFYINHNNLAGLDIVDRKRLITFFILNQTPEKLNPNDRRVLQTR